MLRATLLATLSVSLNAALSLDIDLARLRQAPGAEQVRARIDAMLPAPVKMRLAAMQAIFGFDPRRDLKRVVVEVPDQGAPTIRLFGLPAMRIAQALSLRGEGVALPGGRTGYALPNRPQALFVAIGDDEAVIGRGAPLKENAIAAAPAAVTATISAHLVPGAHPRLDALTLATSVDLAADAAGHVTLAVAAKDEAAAVELQRRLGVIRGMVKSGAEGKLPAMADAQQVLDATTEKRDGARLELAIAMPEALRSRMIDRALDRLQDRIGAKKAAAE